MMCDQTIEKKYIYCIMLARISAVPFVYMYTIQRHVSKQRIHNSTILPKADRINDQIVYTFNSNVYEYYAAGAAATYCCCFCYDKCHLLCVNSEYKEMKLVLLLCTLFILNILITFFFCFFCFLCTISTCILDASTIIIIFSR